MYIQCSSDLGLSIDHSAEQHSQLLTYDQYIHCACVHDYICGGKAEYETGLCVRVYQSQFARDLGKGVGLQQRGIGKSMQFH